tara:strand:- start:938 stop:1279 length:342 start_codon:yes stop_codon:yes gene_type:complete
MIESGFIDEIAFVDCGISTIPALLGYRIYGLRRGLRKHVVLGSPGNLEFVNGTTNSGRGSCWFCSWIRYGHILIFAALYGSPLCDGCDCSHSDRNPHCATASTISVFFLDRHM